MGMQIFNHEASKRLNKELQEKQIAFQKAAAEHDFDRMRRLQAESAKLALELEAEFHNERMDEINNSYDQLLADFGNHFAIANWPLKVLPFVMKGETFGSLFKGTAKSVNIHCIFTPSNCEWFNNMFYDTLDLRLEMEMNKYWNAQTTHPVIYYGGAWNRNRKKTDLNNDIELLRTQLKSVPVIVITPYFDPYYLYFKVNMWGMGQDQDTSFRIDIPHGSVDSNNRIFTYDYNKEFAREYSDGYYNTTVDEFVAYLECLIGFIADKYFWGMYQEPPFLPSVIAHPDNTSIGNGIKNYFKDAYGETTEKLIEQLGEQEALCVQPMSYLKYVNEVRTVLGNDKYHSLLENLLVSIARNRGIKELGGNIVNGTFANDVFLPNESDFVATFIDNYKNSNQQMDFQKITSEDFNLDASKYSEKRNELIKIMDDVLKIKELPKERIEEFKYIRKKCLENQFNIVLIGEFQGGKSTTFNAFCGGREISPRGAMIKTSACPITATNISDPGKEEFALVQWKTDAELLMNIQDVLNKHISAEDTDYDPQSGEIFEPYKYLSLSNPKHLELIKDAVEKEKEKAKLNYDIDAIDICRIADIILKFYNNPKVVEFKNKNLVDTEYGKCTVCSIEEVSRIAVFPENWEMEASEEEAAEEAAFKPEEVMFAFIGGIECYIHSRNLERLGCSITDCPGLFTSAWDTQVAFNTMPRADAVIYLLGGTKQMTDGDKRALSYIKNLETVKDKLFFVINTRNGNSVTQNIVNTDQSIIKSLGFDNVNIHLLNSQLFFLGEFGLSYNAKKLDEFSVNRFKLISSKFDNKSNDLEECWNLTVNDALSTIKNREIKVDSLNKQCIEDILKVSGYRDVFDEIERFIVGKKAYSILIQGGANVVVRSLREIEAGLVQKENDALKDVATCEAEYASALKALENFQNKAREIIDKAFPEHVVDVITSRAYDKIIRNEETLERLSVKSAQALVPVLGVKCKSIAVELKILEKADKHGFLKKEYTKVFNKLRGFIEPVVNDVLVKELGGNIREWVNNVIKGQDNDYKSLMIPQLEELSRKLNEQWEECVQQNSSIEAFKLNPPRESLEEMSNIASKIYIDGKGAVNKSAEIVVQSLVQELIAGLVSTIIATVTVVVLDLLTTGGFIHFLIGIGGGLIWVGTKTGLMKEEKSKKDAKTKEDLTKKEKKLYEPIHTILSIELNKEITKQKIRKGMAVLPKDERRKEEIERGLAELPYKVIERYKDFYRGQLKKQKDDLDGNIEQRRANKKQSLDKQQEIARHAGIMRKEHIIPMRKRVEQFIASCKAE